MERDRPAWSQPRESDDTSDPDIVELSEVQFQLRFKSSSRVSSDSEESQISTSKTTGSTIKSAAQPVRKQRRVGDMVSSCQSFREGGEMANAITKAVLSCIAKDNLPLCTTEREGFLYSMKTVAPQYELPGMNKAIPLIGEKYEAHPPATVIPFSENVDGFS
ncbi:hypothetical protein QAD02_004657 [Eretmocerus hayati]|uniref:Uncharacterized protein n=1 Tax=Eretmocerus hayati TaxID=131215 RepID=A0ACC2NV15_9HYME|nr:hypothetical protein QAD02_004657 [Eretmocerus hayati]